MRERWLLSCFRALLPTRLMDFSTALATGPFIDALPEELPGCEGSGFYALHRCARLTSLPAARLTSRSRCTAVTSDHSKCFLVYPRNHYCKHLLAQRL
jgi:hypothetical protein